MSAFSPERLPEDAEAAGLKREARATLQVYAAFLQNPAFQHRVDIAVLTKIATDDTMAPRERRRSAEMIGLLFLKALDRMAEITGVREQVLKGLGLDPASVKAVALQQVNTSVLVDARQVTVQADRDALRRLLADPHAARLAGALARRLDGGPPDDGAPPDAGPVLDARPPAPPLGGDRADREDRGAAPGPDAPPLGEERDLQRLDAAPRCPQWVSPGCGSARPGAA
jgi:hypothetical protein